MTGEAELIVGPEHTAASVGSGKVGVLATPVMINLIEAAALQAVEDHLPDGHQSLGTYLEVSHIAATPVGMRVRATAELMKVDGRHLELKVRAQDEVEEIGSGMHHRIVVNVAKFDARVARKVSG
jgi:predicted thioesterase